MLCYVVFCCVKGRVSRVEGEGEGEGEGDDEGEDAGGENEGASRVELARKRFD